MYFDFAVDRRSPRAAESPSARIDMAPLKSDREVIPQCESEMSTQIDTGSGSTIFTTEGGPNTQALINLKSVSKPQYKT